ncbi:hypothetical protein [Novipirellula aureliae]|nr:hypothetical protein [Novipirellula aureliae]
MPQPLAILCCGPMAVFLIARVLIAGVLIAGVTFARKQPVIPPVPRLAAVVHT